MTTLAHDGKSSYRPDIDGLRAIAVLAVVLFHIDPALLPGGFAGVDIFFVISGFLITGNIIKDVRSVQGFSWGEFYRRRALRILPVLFFVLLVTLLVGHFTLLPEDLEELSYSALASVFSVANVYFTYFLDTSYFADDSNLQPLLHLWSLGVEEQFYLFWPIILIALLARFSRLWLLWVTLILTLASFVLAELMLPSAPMFAYYMLPTRAGELLIGALLALWLSDKRADMPEWRRLLLSVVGAALIVFSLGWITEDMGFPGSNALPSTIGAALLIWAGSNRSVGVTRILALRPLVLIGLISYSLYLWHWPVLAFYRYVFGVVEPVVGVALFGAMLLLSVVSYRWVEKPCRQLRWSFGQVMMRVVAANAFVVSALCGAIVLSGGLGLYSFDTQYQAQLKALSPAPAAYSYPYVCQRRLLRDVDLQSEACIVNSEREPAVLLWGDSNAAHYVGILGAFAEASGFSFRNAAHSSCPPVLYGVEHLLKPDRVENCRASIDLVKAYLDSYSTIVLGGVWSFYSGRDDGFKANLEQTIEMLVAQGKQVIILGQVPRMKEVVRECSQKALKLAMIKCESGDEGGTAPLINKWLREFAGSHPGVNYFDITDALCRGDRCSAYLNSSLLYYDAGHLSMEGSWFLGRHIVAESGVPNVFSRLVAGKPTYQRDIPLDKSLLARNQSLFDLPEGAWRSLIEGAYSKLWSGSAMQEGKLEKGVVLQDDRDDAYNLVRYRIPDVELQAYAKEGGYLHFRVKIATCTESFPMLRLLVQVGGREVKHDVVLDCETLLTVAKGGFRPKDVGAESEGDSLILRARYHMQSDLDGLEVIFFPASGKNFGAYSPSAIGAVAVDDIELAVVSAHGEVSDFTVGVRDSGIH
ncbi:acyltransferase family protein [Pseudomonas sp. CC6-YY-74]|uniref:acyltransferase family protein n=1 Tax=Pseudomonas sp. CC6-YY-74 TaxID=1930532 RepID=UPI0009A1E9E8|nr:acyltransferase family protein [Pseudomonas sp. CC6-YY-74]